MHNQRRQPDTFVTQLTVYNLIQNSWDFKSLNNNVQLTSYFLGIVSRRQYKLPRKEVILLSSKEKVYHFLQGQIISKVWSVDEVWQLETTHILSREDKEKNTWITYFKRLETDFKTRFNHGKPGM